jgi:hypothetical protein
LTLLFRPSGSKRYSDWSYLCFIGFDRKRRFQLQHTIIIMETGGKGRRKEMIREELHEQLCAGFGVSAIHSEYGMTELLARYSLGNGVFECPSWMQILVRDTEDALTYIPDGKQAEST